jgi:hypothetical protein
VFRRRNRLDDIAETLTQLVHNQGIIMTQQEEIAAAVASIAASTSTLNTAVAGIASALAAKTPVPLDLSGLTSAAADLGTAANAVAALVPAAAKP